MQLLLGLMMLRVYLSRVRLPLIISSPPKKTDRTRFPHTVGLHYFSLGIRCYNADRKQSMGLDDDQ